MARGSIYGANVYGKGLYSAVRHQDVSSVLYISINVDADLWKAFQKLLSASLNINLNVNSNMNYMASYSAVVMLNINVTANPYLGTFWVVKECTVDEWNVKQCTANAWNTVLATPDEWNKSSG